MELTEYWKEYQRFYYFMSRYDVSYDPHQGYKTGYYWLEEGFPLKGNE